MHTTKKTTLQVTFSEEEFLGKLFKVIPEGAVVTAVDVHSSPKNFPDHTTKVTVRLTQPVVDQREDYRTVWRCTPPPTGQPYRVVRDEWTTLQSGVQLQYIDSIEIDGKLHRCSGNS